MTAKTLIAMTPAITVTTLAKPAKPSSPLSHMVNTGPKPAAGAHNIAATTRRVS